MKIKIPKEVKRYTPEVIQILYDQGFFDDTDTIQEKYDDMKNRVSQKFYKRPIKTVGMWLSGGADSAILAYLICKQIKEEQLDIKFQPLSVRRGRPSNPIYAGHVIDFLEKELDFKMNDHIIYYPDINDEYQATNILLETKKKLKIEEVINLIIFSYENFFINLDSYNYVNFKKKADLMA